MIPQRFVEHSKAGQGRRPVIFAAELGQIGIHYPISRTIAVDSDHAMIGVAGK